MAIMQHQHTSLLASSPHLRTGQPSAPISTRPELPPRNVTAQTIEETFVQFILSCNPGIPIDTETSALRESFRSPPKSGGKSFETWTLFELIAQFQSKDIKTWGELALKLGVEPPDQDKGQSSQKIQQYAVRLKRWMHSMHVDAFFEYLLENPHPYWTEVPLDGNPVREQGRDGVAAEDDMALRSLLPHIRPRRGRKRPEDESVSRSPSQKPRMDLATTSDQTNNSNSSVDQQQQQLDLWATAQPTDARGGGPYLYAQQSHFSRMNMDLAAAPGPWAAAGDDFSHQTPLTTAHTHTHPYPAALPITAAGAFWPEQQQQPQGVDSQSMTRTATKSKTNNRRHGAKVVSSAWRTVGPGGSGKTRGRPPLDRRASLALGSHGEAAVAAAASLSFCEFPSTAQGNSPQAEFRHPTMHQSPQVVMDAASLQQHPMLTMGMNTPGDAIISSAARGHPQQQTRKLGGLQQGYDISGQQYRNLRSRLSLQVPERAGAEVRVATPRGREGATAISGEAMSAVGAQASTMAQHQHQQQQNMMAGTEVGQHVMDPFAAAAAQSIYDMSYQHQAQQHQLQLPQHQHQQHLGHTQQIQHIPPAPPGMPSLYSTTTAQSAHNQHQQHPHPSPKPLTTIETQAAADAATTTAQHPPDRTNLPALEALLTYELLNASWTESAAQQQHHLPVTTTILTSTNIDEASALARAIITRLRRDSTAAQGFLTSVGALAAGLAWLRAPGSLVRVLRTRQLGGEDDVVVYEVRWEVQVGDVREGFGVRERVTRGAWEAEGQGGEGADEDGDGDDS